MSEVVPGQYQARPGMWTSTLVYGGPGVGKTPYAISSFYDWKTGQELGNGRWVTFGRENNPALAVPEKYRMLGGQSLRLRSPSLNDFGWLQQFKEVVNALLLKARQGECLDALVIDGMSEFDLLYEMVFDATDSNGDKFAKWNGLMSEMLAIMQRLDPDELGCHVFVTARVMERKRERRSRSATIAGDPAFVDFDYYPSLRGGFRLHFPHYFNMVLYMETQLKLVTVGEWKGQQLPAHVLNMVRTGDFYVKNNWEYQWLRAGEPLQMVNPAFADVYGRLVNLTTGGVGIIEPAPEDYAVDEAAAVDANANANKGGSNEPDATN